MAVVAASTPRAGQRPRSARITAAQIASPLTAARKKSLTTRPGVPENAATRRDGHDHAAVRASTRTGGCVGTAVELTTLLGREEVRSGLGRPFGGPRPRSGMPTPLSRGVFP